MYQDNTNYNKDKFNTPSTIKPSNLRQSTIPLVNLRQLKYLRGISYKRMSLMVDGSYCRAYFCKVLKGDIIPPPHIKAKIGELFGIEPMRIEWGIKDEQNTKSDITRDIIQQKTEKEEKEKCNILY